MTCRIQVWPVCHISDTVDLYMEMLRNILEGNDIGHNESGYYHASSGSVSWEDIYRGVALAMAERGVIADATVSMADDDALARMATGLECPKEMVAVSLSGWSVTHRWYPFQLTGIDISF